MGQEKTSTNLVRSSKVDIVTIANAIVKSGNPWQHNPIM
jgi:hypothetical protein